MLSQDTSQWTICGKPECKNSNVVATMRNRVFASHWIKQFRNAGRMREMSGFLAKPGQAPPNNLAEKDVLEKVVEMLVSGNLHVHAPEEKDVTHGPAGVAFVESPPFPLSDRKRSAGPSRRDSGVDPSTLPDNSDFAAQAAAVVAAAEDGSAFCEVCQKEQQQQ
jgi:hypothetical protein